MNIEVEGRQKPANLASVYFLLQSKQDLGAKLLFLINSYVKIIITAKQ